MPNLYRVSDIVTITGRGSCKIIAVKSGRYLVKDIHTGDIRSFLQEDIENIRAIWPKSKEPMYEDHGYPAPGF